MKGVVFTEFIEFIEDQYGFDTVDTMIEKSGLEAVYTQAGNYPFEEMVALLVALSGEVNLSVNELLEAYGEHLFSILIKLYPHVIQFKSSFDIISHVDNIIHPEVQKLYPDAELPTFNVKAQDEKRLVLEYKSKKSLQHLAKGLILGAAKHYGENITVTLYEDKDPVEIEVTRD